LGSQHTTDTPPKPEATRALALVSKVLQMLANGLSFTHKERYVACPAIATFPND
jgi:hypothetical protein